MSGEKVKTSHRKAPAQIWTTYGTNHQELVFGCINPLISQSANSMDLQWFAVVGYSWWFKPICSWEVFWWVKKNSQVFLAGQQLKVCFHYPWNCQKSTPNGNAFISRNLPYITKLVLQSNEVLSVDQGWVNPVLDGCCPACLLTVQLLQSYKINPSHIATKSADI